MFIDLLLESCEEGGILGNEDKPIFRGYILPDQPEFFLSFTSFQLRQAHWIRNASFLLAIFGRCTPRKYCNDH